MLQHPNAAKEAQKRLPLPPTGRPETGRRLQLLRDNKVAHGPVNRLKQPKEQLVSDSGSIPRRHKQDLVEQLCLQREVITILQAYDIDGKVLQAFMHQ